MTVRCYVSVYFPHGRASNIGGGTVPTSVTLVHASQLIASSLVIVS